jgi:hypothetical protein
MAIIKTKLVNGDRRIITKVVGGQRRVSCSCCPSDVECCMYPAAQLGIGYSQDDLPDSVEVFDQTNTYTFTKNGSIYEFSNLSLRAIDGRWAPFADADEIGDRSQACLIAPNDTLRVTDFFADNYSITKEFTTDERERVSLCVWGGSQGGYLAYYDGNDDFIEFYYSGPPHKWIYIAGTLEPEEGGGVWEKDDPQNGPEGTYSPSANAGDFAGIGTAVVAPA